MWSSISVKITKMAIPPNRIYRLHAVPIKMLMLYFPDLEGSNSRIPVELQKVYVPEAIVRSKNIAGVS